MTSLNFLFLLWHVTFKPLLHISYTSPFTQKILLQQTFEIIEIAFSVLSRFDKLNRNHYLSSKKCFFGERSYSANSVGKRKEQEQWEDLCWRVIQNYLEPFIWWIDSCPCLKACVGYSRSWLEFFYYFLDIRNPRWEGGCYQLIFSSLCELAKVETLNTSKREMCLVHFLEYGNMPTGRRSRRLISAIDGLC